MEGKPQPVVSTYQDLEFNEMSQRLVQAYKVYRKIYDEFSNHFPPHPGYKWIINSFGEVTQAVERAIHL